MSRLDKLKEKQKQLKAQIQSEKNKLRAAERKTETRKKIVFGGAAIRLIEKMPEDQQQAFRDAILAQMSDRDRALFQ